MLSSIILFFLSGWLFGKIDLPQTKKQLQIPVRLDARQPKLAKKQKPIKPKPVKKPSIQANQIEQGRSSSDNIPVIRIYYGQDDTKDYVGYLASRGCIFLVQSGSGKIIAEYNPINGHLPAFLKLDLKGYSPRSRILARYGESIFFDSIIEKAVRQNPNQNPPENCRIIALVSRGWENSLSAAIFNITGTNRIKGPDIASAEIAFKSGQFILKTVTTKTGAKHEINLTLSL